MFQGGRKQCDADLLIDRGGDGGRGDRGGGGGA